MSGGGKSKRDVELPPGWKMYIDPSSGDPYYHNASLKETTWDHPGRWKVGLLFDSLREAASQPKMVVKEATRDELNHEISALRHEVGRRAKRLAELRLELNEARREEKLPTQSTTEEDLLAPKDEERALRLQINYLSAKTSDSEKEGEMKENHKHVKAWQDIGFSEDIAQSLVAMPWGPALDHIVVQVEIIEWQARTESDGLYSWPPSDKSIVDCSEIHSMLLSSSFADQTSSLYILPSLTTSKKRILILDASAQIDAGVASSLPTAADALPSQHHWQWLGTWRPRLTRNSDDTGWHSVPRISSPPMYDDDTTLSDYDKKKLAPARWRAWLRTRTLVSAPTASCRITQRLIQTRSKLAGLDVLTNKLGSQLADATLALNKATQAANSQTKLRTSLNDTAAKLIQAQLERDALQLRLSATLDGLYANSSTNASAAITSYASDTDPTETNAATSPHYAGPSSTGTTQPHTSLSTARSLSPSETRYNPFREDDLLDDDSELDYCGPPSPAPLESLSRPHNESGKELLSPPVVVVTTSSHSLNDKIEEKLKDTDVVAI